MTDAAFIKQARDRFKLAEDAEKLQRQRELEDLRFYAGEQWDDDLLKARAGQTIGSGTTQQVVPARPSLAINKTREPVRQVLNQERQSDLGIELVPADDWGDTESTPISHDEIELREGLVRRIQRDSEATDARTWAFARSAIAGRGYWLVMTRYVPGKSADQEIYIQRIYNQATVLLDPSHEQADGSDAEWGFYGTDMPWDVYKTEFPSTSTARNRVSACSAENDADWRTLGEEAPNWFTGEGVEKRAVRVMNYYWTERQSKTLTHLSDGRAVYDDELDTLPKGVTIQVDKDGKPLTHTEIIKTIKWSKIDGCQKLDETDWPGHWLPIIKVVGEELQPYSNERRCEGIVRPMRDPCKSNNYILSKFVEQIGLTPIPPWSGPAGFDEGFEDEYDAANTRALSRLHWNQRDSFGNIIAPGSVTRTNVSTDVSALAAGVQIFGQAIAATSVVPETALGNVDPSVKSGKLAKALIDQANRGTSNFLDNLIRSMRHEARVVNDLLFPIYGRPGRLARMMNGQGQMSAVIIGKPFTMQGAGKQARPVALQDGAQHPDAKTYTLTENADFNVAVTVKKDTETRRQQIAEALSGIVSASPEQMAIMGDLLWKYLDLPDHEELEKRYKQVLAPPIQALLNGKQPLPPEAQAQIAQLTQANAQLKELADKNVTDLKKTQLQEQEETKRTVIKAAASDQQTRAKNETSITVAELGAKVDRLALFLEERARLGIQANDNAQAEHDRAHDLGMAAVAHAQATQQADQQQQNTLEQGDQGHQQALEQQAAQPMQPEA